MTAASRRTWPLIVRRARPGDEHQVVAFATTTWDGWDYLPRAWPRWIDASDGVLLVGTVGHGGGPDADGKPLDPGSVIAVVRVAMAAAGEAWLEGIRVDPRVRGMDVATDLQVAELQWSAANGAHVVRYATGARNEGSHRLGARAGLGLIVSFLGVSWGSDDHEQSAFDPVVQADAQSRRRALLGKLAQAGLVAQPDEGERIWRGVSGDITFNAGARLCEPRPWALQELTEQKFLNHVAAGEVLHETDADGGKAVAILVADLPAAEDAALRMALVVGIPRAAFELVEATRRTAGETIRFRYPDGAPLIGDMRQSYLDAGWELSDWAMHIMARSIDAAHPVPDVDANALILEDEPRAVITPPR